MTDGMSLFSVDNSESRDDEWLSLSAHIIEKQFQKRWETQVSRKRYIPFFEISIQKSF